MSRALLTAIVASSVFYWGSEPQYVGDVVYHQFSGVTASTVLGPAAPAFAVCGVFFGQAFTAPAEQSYHGGPLLPCYTGSHDVILQVFFSGEASDPLAHGETVIYDFAYRTVGPNGTGLSGNLVTVQVPYTQSGAGADCEAPLLAQLALDSGDGDQPYTYGDTIMGTLSINAGSTYSGDPVVGNVLFAIPYKQVCHAG